MGGTFRLLTARKMIPGERYLDCRRVEQVSPPLRLAGSRHSKSIILLSKMKLATVYVRGVVAGPWAVLHNVTLP